MGLFGKKKNLNDFEDGHNNDLFTDDDDFVLPIDDSPFSRGIRHKAAAPHALTADEVIGNTPETIDMTGGAHPAPQSVYERMKEQRRKEEQSSAFEDDYVPSWATAAVHSDDSNVDTIGTEEIKTVAKEQPTETAVGNEADTVAADDTDDFLERCRMAVDIATTGVHYDSKAFEAFANDDYYKPLDAEAAAKEVNVDDIIRRLKGEHNLPENTYTEKHESEAASDFSPSPAESIIRDIPSAAAFEQEPEAVESTFVSDRAAEEDIPDEINSGTVLPTEVASESELETKSTPEIIQMESAESGSKTGASKLDRKISAFEDDEDVIIYHSPASVIKSPAAEQDESVVDSTVDTSSEIKVQVEVISEDSDSDIMHTDSVATGKTYGKIYHGVVMGRSENGDVQLDKIIDTAKKSAATAVGAAATGAAVGTAAATAVIDELAEGLSDIPATDKTVVFGGLGDIENAISKRADDIDDYDDDYDDDGFADDTLYYETEPKELKDIDDYCSLSDSARLRTRLMGEHTTRFTFTVLSFITTALIALVSSPLSEFFGTVTVGYINLLLLVATILFNLNIFADLKRVVDFKVGFDTCVSVTAVVMLVQNIVSLAAFDGKLSTVSGAAAMLMAVNSLSKTLKLKRTLSGLEVIATSEPKSAVTAAAGAPAEAIASGAVEGEVVALSTRETVNIRSYLKNCGYESPFDLKAKILFVIGVAAAVIVGIVTGIVTDALTGLTLAALTLCACFPACAVLTAELPMYLAASKLSRYGAMLAGFKGAYDLNLSNVLAVKTSDLFPESTVTLYDMKPLGKNEIGHSLVDAAAVAIAAKSPLAPIFKSIIGDVPEKDMPDITGVQYEDKMGITGWIGDRTILIGNRNLMQGHNVSVPPASVDQKILRSGYFPVYIACDGVPCLLFIVKYEADANIAAELQRVCSTGMTVVVYPEDPNASDMMLCDYFGLPNDAIKVMRHNGRVAYDRATVPAESTSAPAGYRKSVCGLLSAVTSAINMSSAITILTVLYAVAAVLAAVLLIYFTVIGNLGIVTSFTFVLFQAVFVGLSALFARTVRR